MTHASDASQSLRMELVLKVQIFSIAIIILV